MTVQTLVGVSWGLIAFFMSGLIGDALRRRYCPAAHWSVAPAIGTAVLFIVHTFLLMTGAGAMMSWAALLLALATLPGFRFGYRPMSRHGGVLLGTLGSLLLVANVLSPLSEWDAQEGYVHFARIWQEQGSLVTDRIHNLYADRSQSVSVLYAWVLDWGNEYSCQALDYAAFTTVVLWLGRVFTLSPGALLVTVLIALGPAVQWVPGSGLRLLPNHWAANIGSAGCEGFQWLWLAALFELRHRIPRAGLCWLLLGIAVLNARWNSWVILPLLTLGSLWICTRKKRFAAWAAATFLIGSLSLLWNWHLHGNPVYPHAPEHFGGGPYNTISAEYFTDYPKLTQYGVRRPHNLHELLLKSMDIGLGMLLLPLALFQWRTRRNWVMLALGLSACNMLVTAQPRFQAMAILVGTALWVGAPARQGSAWATSRATLVGLAVAMSWVTVSDVGRSAWATLRDFRHGPEEMYGNRLRLWPAITWLNDRNAEGAVIFPHNPSYWCRADVWRADQLAYSMSDPAIASPDVAATELKQRGFRWIVRAPDFYNTSGEIGPSWTRFQVDWMIENDPAWKKVAVLPASRASPETEIWRLDDGTGAVGESEEQESTP